MIEDQKKPKAIEVYLKAMQLQDNAPVNELFWWQKLNEKGMMQTMQKFCWDNSIDFNTINWGKFLRGEHTPQSWEIEDEV